MIDIYLALAFLLGCAVTGLSMMFGYVMGRKTRTDAPVIVRQAKEEPVGELEEDFWESQEPDYGEDRVSTV